MFKRDRDPNPGFYPTIIKEQFPTKPMIWYDKGTKFTWHADAGAGQQLDPMSMMNGDQEPAQIDMSGAVPDAQPIDRVAAAQAANDEMLRKRAELAREKAA